MPHQLNDYFINYDKLNDIDQVRYSVKGNTEINYFGKRTFTL